MQTIDKSEQNKIVIYQNSSGAIELRGDIKNETIWATQAQIVDLFNVDQSVISRHIRNIFKDKEIEGKSNMQKMHIASSDKPVILYSLDVILSVGYRTNSKIAIAFRKWATKTLREHITKGFTINRKQISKNYSSFMKAVSNIEKLLPEDIVFDSRSTLELIKSFANTWISLDAYDREALRVESITKKKVKLTAEELFSAILDLKNELIKNKKTTDLFAMERQNGNIEGIVGNIMQSFGGKFLYESIEEKAANLLYLIIKNHPFIDGNKRSGAFAFIWFLKKNKIKGFKNINSTALTSLTLLIAISNPKEKEQMIALITQFLHF